MCWHVAKTPLSKENLEILIHAGDIMVDDHRYPSGGSDQFRICAFDIASAMFLLDNPVFIKAAKIFNLARMRSGAQPYSRYHAPALGDELLAKI